jgi:hypothetical protein
MIVVPLFSLKHELPAIEAPRRSSSLICTRLSLSRIDGVWNLREDSVLAGSFYTINAYADVDILAGGVMGVFLAGPINFKRRGVQLLLATVPTLDNYRSYPRSQRCL